MTGKRELRKALERANARAANRPRPDVSAVYPRRRFNWWDRWGGAILITAFVLALVAGVVTVMLLWRSDSLAQLERQRAWESHCESIGGVVVEQYRAPTWCLVGAEIVDTYDWRTE